MSKIEMDFPEHSTLGVANAFWVEDQYQTAQQHTCCGQRGKDTITYADVEVDCTYHKKSNAQGRRLY